MIQNFNRTCTLQINLFFTTFEELKIDYYIC